MGAPVPAAKRAVSADAGRLGATELSRMAPDADAVVNALTNTLLRAFISVPPEVPGPGGGPDLSVPGIG